MKGEHYVIHCQCAQRTWSFTKFVHIVEMCYERRDCETISVDKGGMALKGSVNWVMGAGVNRLSNWAGRVITYMRAQGSPG